MDIDKTVVFAVDNKSYVVADLPLAIRKQFDILDAFRQEMSDIAVKYEMAQMAVSVKVAQLQEIVRQAVAPAPTPAPVQSAPEAANEDEASN